VCVHILKHNWEKPSFGEVGIKIKGGKTFFFKYYKNVNRNACIGLHILQKKVGILLKI